MVLNIVKNDLPASCIAEYVRCVFDNAKVNIKDENAVSVDIEVTGKNELHSLEGLKELEYYFKDYDRHATGGKPEIVQLQIKNKQHGTGKTYKAGNRQNLSGRR